MHPTPIAGSSQQVGPALVRRSSTPSVGIARSAQPIHPSSLSAQVQAPVALPSSGSLGSPRTLPWLSREVTAFMADAKHASYAFRRLHANARQGWEDAILVTHEPGACSRIRWCDDHDDVNNVMVIASHDAPTPYAMKVAVTRMLVELAASAELEPLIERYVQGDVRPQATTPGGVAFEQLLVTRFGCDEQDARYVAAGLRMLENHGEHAAHALRELHARQLLPASDQTVERFLARVGDPRTVDENIRELIGVFQGVAPQRREAMETSTEQVSQAAPPWSVHEALAFLEAGQEWSSHFRKLVTDSRLVTIGRLQATDHPMATSGTHLTPDGSRNLVVATHDAPTVVAMKVAMTGLLAHLAIFEQLEPLLSHYQGGGAHATPSGRLEGLETWLAAEFGSGEAEARYVARGIEVVHAYRQTALDAVSELRFHEELPARDEHLDRFVSTVSSPSEIAAFLIDDFRRQRRAAQEGILPAAS